MLRRLLSGILQAWRLLGVAFALLLVVAYLSHIRAPRSQPQAGFHLLGPQGEAIVVQLPELANIPPLDVAAACAKVSAHNAKARASLMEAEPILRDAQAKGYLEELAKVRSRLDRAESRS